MAPARRRPGRAEQTVTGAAGVARHGAGRESWRPRRRPAPRWAARRQTGWLIRASLSRNSCQQSGALALVAAEAEEVDVVRSIVQVADDVGADPARANTWRATTTVEPSADLACGRGSCAEELGQLLRRQR
jgi:hypothetical protein